MRILQVAHGFPPDQMAGAEVYTWSVSRELAARGHEVTVLAPMQRGQEPERALVEERVDGVRVLRMEQRYSGLDRLEGTYRDARVEPVFAEVVRDLQPQVVHVQHTIGLSSGLIPLARQLGVPVLMTLHDFWFHCPRGQRMTPRGHLCTKVQPWRCSLCVGRKRAAYFVRWLGEYAGGRARESQGEGAGKRALMFAPRLATYAAREALRAPILRRLERMRADLLAADLLLAPSRFLLERFVEQGIPRERMEFSEYGMDDTPFRSGPPRPARDPAARPVRFGFVGSLIPNKGPEVLLRGFERMPHGECTLDLFGAGSGPTGASYEAHLQASATHPGIAFRGRFDNKRVAEILAGLDVLVVPSLWWENAPLTIHEAVMARMPVVTADHGGMKELAGRFGNAALFRPGDAEDLARALRRFLDEPDIWTALQPRRAVRSVADDVDGLLARYTALSERAAGQPARASPKMPS